MTFAPKRKAIQLFIIEVCALFGRQLAGAEEGRSTRLSLMIEGIQRLL
jgi:hypothetical protein